MSVTAGVAAIKGTYAGEVSLSDKVAPELADDAGLGRRRPGHDRRRRQGAASRPSAGGGTELHLRRRRLGRRRDRRRRPADARRRDEEDGRPVLHRPSTATSPVARRAGSARAERGAVRRRCAASAARAASGAVYAGRAATANAQRRPWAWTPGPGSPSGCSSVACWPWPASRSAPGSGRQACADARLHGRRRPGRARCPARSPRRRCRPTSTSSSTSPAGASRRPAPSSSCCPSRRPRASPPASRRRSSGSWCPSCPARSSRRCVDVAAELGIHLVVGTYERGPTPDVVYNSSVLIDPRGRGARRLPQDAPVLLRGVSVAAGGSPPATPSRCATPSSAGSA